MGRVSQAQARENRQRVVETAARLFREQGAQVSVADLMKASGLTHGAFYKQFASKEALFDEATAQAFDAVVHGTDRHHVPLDASPHELIDAYLSAEHRDDTAEGCPVAALAVDIARGQGGPAARDRFSKGAAEFAQHLATDENDGLSRLSLMVGALILSRATQGTPISEEILAAARAALAAVD
ncbi:TetR family transcriptional regulator [Streptomyces sp. NPDC002596]|uniref:TetR family transcriptional regulator n=1 Tax=unclassified Streptomyces TaxID=2593676 RepID=UPI0022500C81|nr:MULTISPECIES: TetR family transcriptional regulator [unclassified Streptomyces]MCX4538061.1 TetR/AcrR family transcriptional regulator [Streptomyces sp. NBC_01669]WSA05235.1 TetR/AcrR family transcriptional regulator [Streptomyces sp. NBC_00841]